MRIRWATSPIGRRWWRSGPAISWRGIPSRRVLTFSCLILTRSRLQGVIGMFEPSVLPASQPPLARWPALAAVGARPRKDVVVAVQSNFTDTDPYDANDTLSQAVAKSFYQGLLRLRQGHEDGAGAGRRATPSARTGWSTPSSCTAGIKFHDGTRLQRRGREGQLRPRHQPREQAQALQPLQEHRQDRGGGRDHRARHAQGALLALHQHAGPSLGA